jgi:hypothetical protein
MVVDMTLQKTHDTGYETTDWSKNTVKGKW